MEDLPNLYFMSFERYEIHIQADMFYGNLSFFDPHIRKTIFEIYTHLYIKMFGKQKQTPNKHTKKHGTWDLHFVEKNMLVESQIDINNILSG